MDSYKQLAKESRLKCLDLVYKAQTSHIGSLFSCADIFAVLFSKIDFKKDIFIAGKSWSAALLYFHLWKRGRISLKELDSYCIGDSKFIGLIEAITEDIPFGIGSMGTGFPAAVGFALAKKLKGEEGKVYCLISDGELNVGTTWESALIASKFQLSNLVVLVDSNGFSAMGKTDDILPCSFPDGGWYKSDIDGHDFLDVECALNRETTRPHVIIARTTKGKGVSFFEGENIWHYKSPNEDEYLKAQTELLHG